jgi:hypothetical protein
MIQGTDALAVRHYLLWAALSSHCGRWTADFDLEQSRSTSPQLVRRPMQPQHSTLPTRAVSNQAIAATLRLWHEIGCTDPTTLQRVVSGLRELPDRKPSTGTPPVSIGISARHSRQEPPDQLEPAIDG